MARKLRVEYPGAIYHVMNRGDRREPIFHDDADRQRFVESLTEACTKPTVILTSTHAETSRVQQVLTDLSLILSGLRNAAEQLTTRECWARIWKRILTPFNSGGGRLGSAA